MLGIKKKSSSSFLSLVLIAIIRKFEIWNAVLFLFLFLLIRVAVAHTVMSVLHFTVRDSTSLDNLHIVHLFCSIFHFIWFYFVLFFIPFYFILYFILFYLVLYDWFDRCKMKMKWKLNHDLIQG